VRAPVLVIASQLDIPTVTDTAATAQPLCEDAPRVHPNATLAVFADASPGLLPRLMEPMAKRDVIPDAVEARREGDVMRLEITLLDVDDDTLQRILGEMGRIVGLRSLRLSDTAPGEATDRVVRLSGRHAQRAGR